MNDFVNFSLIELIFKKNSRTFQEYFKNIFQNAITKAVKK